MKTLTIQDEDYPKVIQILTENGIHLADSTAPVLRQGERNMDDTPANFGGIWANDERTIASIREKAWPKRN